MESIILIILFGLASTIFQTVNNRSKREKMPEKKPAVKKVSRPIEKKEAPHMFMEPDAYDIEGEQTETLRTRNMEEPKDQYEVVEEDSGLWSNITMEELQRSIIMAEVLGKPKALRRK